MTIYLFLILNVKVAFAWPENIKTTYQMEVLRNLGLSSSDYQYMAIAILIKNYGYSRQEAIKIAKNLSDREAKKYLLEDFSIDYYEIPLTDLKEVSDFNSEFVDKNEFNKIYFIEDGQVWIRWFQNPLHESAFIENNFSKYKKNGRFRALQTSSRSLLVKDIVDNFVWSHKSSLKQAQGPFKRKEFSSKNADFQFQMSSVFKDDVNLKGKIFNESSFISLSTNDNSFDEGQLTRSLSPFQSEHKFLTLASLFNIDIATRIAKENGYNKNWEDFFKEKIMVSLGSTVGYIYEKYGLIHNSLHSQNIVVEFDSKGKFVGVLLRDPDFNIDLEKFEKVVLPEKFKHTMKSTNYFTNVFNKENLSIDFSVLNGLKRIDMLFVDKNKYKEFYREMASSFLEGVLSKIAQIKNSSISTDELKSRSALRAFIQEDGGDVGSRLSFQLPVLEIDKLLNINESIPSYNKLKLKISTADAKKVILDSLVNKDISINDYNEFDTSKAWNLLVNDFLNNPEVSELAILIKKNDPVIIRRLISMLNINKTWKVDVFFRHLLITNPDILQHDIGFFFNSHYDIDLMRLYLTKASSKQIFSLWSFLSANRLLDYPIEILNRFMIKVPLDKVEYIKSVIMENEAKALALRSPKLSQSRNELVNAINLRNVITNKLNNKCEKLFN